MESRKRTLLESFASIPDPRHPQGRRHPLPSILAMTTAALLCGCRSLDAIAQWGRVNLVPDLPLFRSFGFTSFTSPAPSTLHEVFTSIDIAAVERTLTGWVQALLPSGQVVVPVSIDGKTLCGSQDKQAQVPGVHLLSAFAQHPGCTLLQQRVDEKTNEPKAALALLAQLILQDTVIVGDAIFCQKELCAQIVQQGGDYLFVVKDNQPTLKKTIAEAFETPVSPLGTNALAG